MSAAPAEDHPPSPDVLRACALRQCGVLSREQVRAAGISAKVERARVARGEWSRRGRAIVWHAHAQAGDRFDAWALQLDAGPAAIVSGPLAARLGGWDVAGSERIVILGEHDAYVPPGVTVLRRDNPAWPVQPRGLRLAAPLDALADTLICRGLGDAYALLDHALQRRWFTAEEFDELIGHRAGHGRRGVGRLRTLYRRILSGSRSEAEHRMARLLQRSGTGRWWPNHPILDPSGRVVAEIDFAHVDHRIAVEVDGRAHHSDEQAFERDRARQNDLIGRGWTVLRFTWRQMVDAPDQVVAAIRAAIAANSG